MRIEDAAQCFGAQCLAAPSLALQALKRQKSDEGDFLVWRALQSMKRSARFHLHFRFWILDLFWTLETLSSVYALDARHFCVNAPNHPPNNSFHHCNLRRGINVMKSINNICECKNAHPPRKPDALRVPIRA